MSIFRRIIIITWLRAFVGALLTLLLLITVGNLLSGILRSNVTPFEVLINHIIQLFDYLPKVFPISALIASLFALNHLVNRNELTAMFALGMTRIKFLSTITLLALFISIVQLGLVGFVQPVVMREGRKILRDASEKFRNLKKEGIRSRTLNTGKTWFRSEGYFFSFETYDPAKHLLNEPTFFFITEDMKIAQIIRAKKAVYKKEHLWDLTDVQLINDTSAANFPYEKELKHYEVRLDETPDSFKQIDADIKVLNLVKLSRYVRKLKSAKINTAEYEIILYQKISSALLTILFALLSSVAVFNPNRRASSFGKNIFFVLVFTIIYWLVDSYVVQLGNNNIVSPSLVSFILPLLFLLYLSVFFYRHRKIS